jgi:hypothetical protein
MSELHSTGVPTPFDLELSLELEDCHEGERRAHFALSAFRVASNREFFNVPVKRAITQLLPHLPRYRIVDVKDSHDIESLQAEIQRRRKHEEYVESQRLRQLEEQRHRVESERLQRISGLQKNIHLLRKRLSALGAKPVEEESHPIENILWFCYFPIPLGWMVWLGTLTVFSKKDESIIGWLCIVILVLGHFVTKGMNAKREAHQKLTSPFWELENEISVIEKQIQNERASSPPNVSDSAPQPPAITIEPQMSDWIQERTDRAVHGPPI